MPTTRLLELSEPYWPSSAASASPRFKQTVLGLVQERLKFLSELQDLTEFFFQDPTPQDITSNLPSKVEPSQAAAWVAAAAQAVDHFSDKDFTAARLEEVFRGTVEPSLSSGIGPLFMTLRVAVTGRTATPGLFETMEALGRDITLKRLEAARALFSR